MMVCLLCSIFSSIPRCWSSVLEESARSQRGAFAISQQFLGRQGVLTEVGGRKLLRELNVWSVFEHSYRLVPRPKADREYTPAN
jgi:hypothetical protein